MVTLSASLAPGGHLHGPAAGPADAAACAHMRESSAATHAAGKSAAAELAYHWREANDLPRAFEASVRAGLAADAMYALPDARANYARALELWDAVPDAETRSPIDRVDLLLRLALATTGSSPRKAAEYLRAAIAIADACRRSGSGPRSCEPSWRSHLSRERGRRLAETRAAVERYPRRPAVAGACTGPGPARDDVRQPRPSDRGGSPARGGHREQLWPWRAMPADGSASRRWASS